MSISGTFSPKYTHGNPICLLQKDGYEEFCHVYEDAPVGLDD